MSDSKTLFHRFWSQRYWFLNVGLRALGSPGSSCNASAMRRSNSRNRPLMAVPIVAFRRYMKPMFVFAKPPL